MFRSRKASDGAPLRFEGRSVQLLAAWTLVIAGAASTGQQLAKPRQGSQPTGLSNPVGPSAAPSVSTLSARATRR